MNEVDGLRENRLCMFSIFFLISLGVLIVTVPLHETLHWVMSEIDPYVEPVEIHFFDEKSLSYGVGYVLIREAYPGSFKDRPTWIDAVQEIICCSTQIIIAILVCIKTFVLLRKRRPKFIYTVSLV